MTPEDFLAPVAVERVKAAYALPPSWIVPRTGAAASYLCKLSTFTVTREKQLLVRGAFSTHDGVEVGWFERLLYRVGGGRWAAEHKRIEISAPHRGHRIAFHHYAGLLRLYTEELDAEYVALQADDLGPIVWPSFGFDFRDDASAIANELGRHVVLDDPSGALRGATLASLGAENERPGLDAIRQVYNREKLVMPMLLDLRDARVLTYLRSRRLLSDDEGPTT